MAHRGKRGSDKRTDFIKSVHVEAKRLIPNASTTAIKTLPAKVFYECHEINEIYNPETDNVEQVWVEDKSLTKVQHLRLFPTKATEVIDLPGRRLDKVTGLLVRTSDPKVLSRSDSTLLNRSIPFLAMPILKRETSRSKRVSIDSDAPIVRERKVSNPGIELDFDAPPKGRTSGKIHKTKP